MPIQMGLSVFASYGDLVDDTCCHHCFPAVESISEREKLHAICSSQESRRSLKTVTWRAER